MRIQFDHYSWINNASPSLCNYRHPISRHELRKIGHLLEPVLDSLINCANLRCIYPLCEAMRGLNGHDRLVETIRRIHCLIGILGLVIPVEIMSGVVSIVNVGRGSSSTTVVQNVLPQEVHREVVEEHVYQPAPIHETETKTWVHRADGSKYLARVETNTNDGSSSKVEEALSDDEDRGHKRGKKKSERRMIRERGESGDEDKGKRRRSRDRGHDRRRSKSRDHGHDKHRSRDKDDDRRRSRSRDRGHEKHKSSDRRRIKDRSRSNDREHDRRKSQDRSRHESSKDKVKDRKKHDKRSRSRERSRRKDDHGKHKYEESEREYDSSPSRRSSSRSSSVSRSN
ncbi:hypothetical protein PMIN06_001204 [Paraphaeosphaeria minitans]|uniref:Uncharacterized protein n=1 Tax=Paraphaeosphaeria minitans TaxID=565426 RepID=A0A9P6GKL8_9PLEO|nr:hypothetical protein PMIN01_05170 [Paraphaeosphaeria minitans]